MDRPSSEPGFERRASVASVGLVAAGASDRSQVGVRDAAVLHIGEVRLDAEAVERLRQEVEEALVGDFEALDLRALAVRRTGDLHRSRGHAIVGDVSIEDAVLNVIVELLVEDSDAELADVAEIVFERQVELPRGRRLQIWVVGVCRIARIDADRLPAGTD